MLIVPKNLQHTPCFVKVKIEVREAVTLCCK